MTDVEEKKHKKMMKYLDNYKGTYPIADLQKEFKLGTMWCLVAYTEWKESKIWDK